jgi:hypothetical protein
MLSKHFHLPSFFSATMAMREERPTILSEPAGQKPAQPASGVLPARPPARETSAGLSSRPGSRPGSSLQLNTPVPPGKDLTSQLNLEVRPVAAPAPVPPPIPVSTVSARPVAFPTPKEFVPRPIEVSIDPTMPSPFSSSGHEVASISLKLYLVAADEEMK